MADGVNLFDLAAKISVDASQSDKALTDTQKKVIELAKKYEETEKKVVDAHKHMGQAAQQQAQQLRVYERSTLNLAQAFKGDLGGALTSLSPRITALAGAGGPLTLMAVGFTAIVGASIAAVSGIVAFTTAVVRSVDDIGDMSEKINFSVRTISGLKPAIEASGGSLEGLTNALGIFDKNIEAAAQGEERLSKLFKALKIDATDNEKAFRQVAALLIQLGGTSQQTALAMELFGRSGKDVLGIIKETGGDIDGFIRRMEALGIVLDESGVKKADEFDKQLVLLQNQVDAVKRQLAMELLPLVQRGAENISNWLKNNQGEIRNTITEIVNLTLAVSRLVNYIMSINPVILTVKVVSMFSKLLPDNSQVGDLGKQYQRNLFTIDPVTGRRIYQGNQPYEDAGEFAVAGGAGQHSVGAGAGGPLARNELADRVRKLLARGGGGRGGAAKDPIADMKRLADAQLKIAEEGIKREEDDIKRSYEQRRTVISTFVRAMTSLENERHNLILKSLTDEENAIKKQPDSMKKKIALTDIELKKAQEMNRHRQEENRLVDNINQATRERIALTETLIKQLERSRYASDVILHDLGGGSVQVDEATRGVGRTTRRVSDRTRPRIATEQEEAMRRQYEEYMARIRGLASDLTYTIDNAIHEGFTRGVKAGVLEFARGLLQIAESAAMKALENRLTDLLSNIGNPGSGSGKGGFLGILSKIIIPIIGGGLGGGFGGGSGSAGGIGSVAGGAISAHAGGGMMRPYEWSWVGERGPELIRAGNAGATVLSNRQSGGNVVHNHYWNIVTPNAASFGSRETQAQIARRMTRIQQKVALTG